MKRLLVFVLLLVGGFLALHQLVGEDLFVSKASTDEGETDRPVMTGGTNIGEPGTINAKASLRGFLDLGVTRKIAQSDGSYLLETVYTLHAEDSRPLRDGLQQLDDVTVTLHSKGGDNEANAVVRARQALVELGTDANGDPSIRADKAVSLTDMVFTGLPGSRAEDLRLELERADVFVDDIEMQINTPSTEDPVLLTFAGERSVSLRGKGLQARLPRNPSGALRRVDIHILSEPIIQTEGFSAKALGRLNYSEDMASRTGRLSLEDQVEIVLEQREKVTVRGDRMLAWIVRHERAADDGTAGRRSDDLTESAVTWRMLQLEGAPATIELEQLALSTPRLTLLPGITGIPFWISTSGGTSSIRGAFEVGKGKPPAQLRANSPQRIDLWQPSEHLGAIHRSFGFPQWAVAPLMNTRVAVFAGKTHLEDDTRSIDSSEGMRIYHLDPKRHGVLARGFGRVELEQRQDGESDPMTLKGNDGFFLVSGPEDDVLDLGPVAHEEGWANHRFELEQGDLKADGSGACRVERHGESAAVEMLAGERDIRADLKDRGARLDGARWMHVELEGKDVTSFAMAGTPATATMVRGDETLVATAPRIDRTGRASLRMLPPDPERPELWQDLAETDMFPRLVRDVPFSPNRAALHVDTTAAYIDILHLGSDDVLVDARSDGDVMAHAEAKITEAEGAEPVLVTFDAGRLRALPFVIPPAVTRFHAGGGDVLSLLPFAFLSDPWILGDDVRLVRIVDPTQGEFEGTAKRLVLSAGAQAGILVGDPDSMTPAQAVQIEDGRRVMAKGAQVRISRDESVGLQAFRTFPGRPIFVLPEIEMHTENGRGPLDHMRATCQGDIEVRPENVNFNGPVTAVGLNPDGSVKPDGLTIVAQRLDLARQLQTGKVQRATGKDVTFEWDRIRGRAAEIDLDLEWKTVVAADPNGASVELASGLLITAERIKVDYDTLTYDYSKARTQPLPENRGDRDGVIPR